MQRHHITKHKKNTKNKQLLNKRNGIVEIDESKIAKRMYNKCHVVEGAWIIGGIQRSRLKSKVKLKTRKCFQF